MVPEQIIDEISHEIGSTETSFSEALFHFKEEQPVVLGFLFTENFDVFTLPEKEFLLFLVVVIFESVKQYSPTSIPEITPEQLSLAEEMNWSKINQVETKRFRDRITTLFEDYPQEDLLAFAEDALADEEEGAENFVTKESREAIFILLKSLIDCFCGLVPEEIDA